MKKIIFNGMSIFNPGMFGIKRNTLELLKELDKIIAKDEVSIIVPAGTGVNVDFRNIRITEVNNKLCYCNNRITRKLCKLKWLYYDANKEKKKENAVLVDSMLEFPVGADVIMIYDCIPELFPDCFNSVGGIIYRYRIKYKQLRAIRECKLLITDSFSASSDINKIYHTSSDIMRVVPCGWEHFITLGENDLRINELKLKPYEYFFSLGNKLKHKNLKWVIEAAKQNPDELFVVSGNRDKSFTDISNNVIFTGFLEDEEIKAFMKNCKAFILPSFYEGFGIPPLEAMSVGADCIIANTGSLPEVYRNSVWYIDPYNYDSIDMKSIMNRTKEPNELILREYSWKKSASMFLDVINELR